MSYKNLCTIKAPQDIHQAFLIVKTQRKKSENTYFMMKDQYNIGLVRPHRSADSTETRFVLGVSSSKGQ
jgi:hypothetical protein